MVVNCDDWYMILQFACTDYAVCGDLNLIVVYS